MTKDLFFFDPDKARGASDRPDVGEDSKNRAPISVSALIGRIKGALSDAFPQRVTVVGELSNVKRHTSGHLYFRMKDSEASIDAAMFRQHAGRLKFEPEDGLEVVVVGRLDVYDVRGQLQLYVELMIPKGAGALELAFRQLREKLAGEGLFDPTRKKPIPRFPRAIGVVSSATGAAIRDIRRTLGRRWSSAAVYLLPVLVQGEGSAEQIADAIKLLDTNAERLEIDTIIIARGGGTLEDLWAFNEELVARAIFAARTPVISGVGHEVDVTIADLVADLRAATPTGAAELATPDGQEIRRHVGQLLVRLRRIVTDGVGRSRASLEAVLRIAVFRDPQSALRTAVQRVDELTRRLDAGEQKMLARFRRHLEPVTHRLVVLQPELITERARAKLDRLASRVRWALGASSRIASDAISVWARRIEVVHPRYRLHLGQQKIAAIKRQLEAMSHRSALRRGFSVTRRAGGGILRSTKDVRSGEYVETELADGKFRSVVEAHPAKQPTEKPVSSPKAKNCKKLKGTGDAERTLFD